MLELRAGTLHYYHGNYDNFLVEKEARKEQQAAAFKNQQREIAHLQVFVDRFGAKASMASRAKSKEKQIERLKEVAVEEPTEELRKMNFKFPQPPRSGLKVIELTHVQQAYGNHVVYRDLNFTAQRGDRIVLVGPNGAGKTTLAHLLSGFLAPSAGEVLLAGAPITRMAQHARVKQGLARTFQINRLFAELTVLESVAMAVCERRGEGGHWWKPLGAHTAALDEAAGLLTRLRLDDAAHVRTHHLAYGQQRLLEIALALACGPRVLLLDEPAAGVARDASRALFDTIAALPRDLTIVLIEHDMDLVFRFADRISVLVGGGVLAEGTPADIAADARVRQVYLGGPTHG